MPDLALYTAAVDAEVITFIRRRQIERGGTQFRFGDIRAQDDTVALVAEQDILHTETTPTAADVYIQLADIALGPYALNRTIILVFVTIVEFARSVCLCQASIPLIRLAFKIKIPFIVNMEFSLQVQIGTAPIVAVDITLYIVIIPGNTAKARKLDAVFMLIEVLVQALELRFLALDLIFQLAVLVLERGELISELLLLLLQRRDAAVEVRGRCCEHRAREAQRQAHEDGRGLTFVDTSEHLCSSPLRAAWPHALPMYEQVYGKSNLLPKLIRLPGYFYRFSTASDTFADSAASSASVPCSSASRLRSCARRNG